MVITKDLARRFCAFFNQATEGQTIHVHGNGSVFYEEHKGCWLSVDKGPGDGFRSTQDAYAYLEQAWKDAIKNLNDSAKRVPASRGTDMEGRMPY